MARIRFCENKIAVPVARARPATGRPSVGAAAYWLLNFGGDSGGLHGDRNSISVQFELVPNLVNSIHRSDSLNSV